MSVSSIPVFGHPKNSPLSATLRRTRRWSWMISGWFESRTLLADEGGTACLTLGCSDDFVAARLGFPNLSRNSWRIERIIARPSSSFNDYVTPTGNASWTTFTAENAGAEASHIVSGGSGSTEIEIGGVGEAPYPQMGDVRWTWTDWVPIRSLVPDGSTAMRVLMIRALIPSSQTVTFATGQLRQLTGNNGLNGGHDILIGGLKFNIDMVSDPDNVEVVPTQAWVDNQLVAGTLFPMVQLLTSRAGISGIATGDSHVQGTSTTEQFFSFLYQATTALGQKFAGNIPFGMTNCAVGGLTSESFFGRLEVLLAAVRPSYAVLPGWTFNDDLGNGKADQTAMGVFLARLLSICELCERNGIAPIILTPFPRNADAMTEVQLAPWRWLREVLMRLNDPRVTVIDATSILGHKQLGLFDGTYRPEFSNDEMHPNDQGHAAVARALIQVVTSRL